MSVVDLSKLIDPAKLNARSRDCLREAAGLCKNRSQYDVMPEHLLQALLQDTESDAFRLLDDMLPSVAVLQKRNSRALEAFRTGNTGRPQFSKRIVRWLEEAWYQGSLDFSLSQTRSASLLCALLENPSRFVGGHVANLLQEYDSVGAVRRFNLLADSKETKTGGELPDAGPDYSPSTRGFRLRERLSTVCKRTLDAAEGLCLQRGHGEVAVEHFLHALIDDDGSDAQRLVKQLLGDQLPQLDSAIRDTLDGLEPGRGTRPGFSRFLERWLEDAWMIASVEFDLGRVRSAMLVCALCDNPSRYLSGRHADLFEEPGKQDVIANFKLCVDSEESGRGGSGGGAPQVGGQRGGGVSPADGSALTQYGTNFTQRAREGHIDPVFGRDREIRQMIDILARRRKNNPIICGEAGVGKTALVEGLALRIVEKDVPDLLQEVELVGLDMGLLQAGAGVKGEFENRLKSVIEEVKASPTPIIMFIDEAHTLIGAGGKAGGSDAANLLKPALARGELRTVAATTWSEYKKYFEKDAALSRRFQLVKLDEPDVAATATMLRGLRERYEEAHGVIIRDDALVAAAELGARYITGRQHPDKGIDLVDTAAARVRVALTAKPADLEDTERLIATLQRELDALRRDAEECAVDVSERAGELEGEIEAAHVRVGELEAEWQAERSVADRVVNLRRRLRRANNPEEGEPEERLEGEEESTPEELRVELHACIGELHEAQGKNPLVSVEVTPEVVGRVVSDWTGIPLGKMVRDQAHALLDLEDTLHERIKGQNHALTAIGTAIRAAKAGLKSPNTPMGVFLFAGPSGVGKTETALGVADIIFGGERMLTTINMSEFQEKHTVSRLIGSPPGYVGYGEGGVLTEAVRQRPYSAVLLDEVEKAHPEVLNIFYQVFDKGMLADGEGRIVDFKDTILFLTSNLGSDLIMSQCDGWRPEPEQLTSVIRPVLSDHFKPALLARMNVVPFYPIDPSVMAEIVRLKLGHLAERLEESHRMALDLDERVIQAITERCTEVETGARNIDAIINARLLPRISSAILEQMAVGPLPDRLGIGLGEDGDFVFEFSEA